MDLLRARRVRHRLALWSPVVVCVARGGAGGGGAGRGRGHAAWSRPTTGGTTVGRPCHVAGVLLHYLNPQPLQAAAVAAASTSQPGAGAAPSGSGASRPDTAASGAAGSRAASAAGQPSSTGAAKAPAAPAGQQVPSAAAGTGVCSLAEAAIMHGMEAAAATAAWPSIPAGESPAHPSPSPPRAPGCLTLPAAVVWLAVGTPAAGRPLTGPARPCPLAGALTDETKQRLEARVQQILQVCVGWGRGLAQAPRFLLSALMRRPWQWHCRCRHDPPPPHTPPHTHFVPDVLHWA